MTKITSGATVIKRDYRVAIIFLWLTLLTIFVLHDTIEIDKVQPLPPLEVLEIN